MHCMLSGRDRMIFFQLLDWEKALLHPSFHNSGGTELASSMWDIDCQEDPFYGPIVYNVPEIVLCVAATLPP